MARVYQITEEEMYSLIDSLKMEKMDAKADGLNDLQDMHRRFHYVVVRWAQAMGFRGHR